MTDMTQEIVYKEKAHDFEFVHKAYIECNKNLCERSINHIIAQLRNTTATDVDVKISGKKYKCHIDRDEKWLYLMEEYYNRIKYQSLCANLDY